MRITWLFFLAPTSVMLSGCYTISRLYDTGDVPTLTRTQDPTAYPDYQPVRMPMPPAIPTEHLPNSLWRAGAKSFFKDQRASKVGDIVTVKIKTDEKAETKNDTSFERDSRYAVNTPHLFGYESEFGKIFPNAVDPANLISTNSKPEMTSKSEIKREEKLEFAVAAIVTQVLPNGKFVIMGRQEIRVNFEVRDVLLTGVIQPEDISTTNEITLDKVAEARIIYGGRGQFSDMMKAPYGQELMSNIVPF